MKALAQPVSAWHLFKLPVCASLVLSEYCQVSLQRPGSVCKHAVLHSQSINTNLQNLVFCKLDAVNSAFSKHGSDGAGAATALLMTTIAPQNTFPAQHCESENCYNNAAAWCIFSTMEHSYLARLTGGCRILLANVMGQVAMVIVALLVNNLDADPAEGYPQRWL